MSGEHEGSAVCCLCGFIAEADDWEDVDHAWNMLLERSPRDFDPAACLRGTGMFQSWDILRRHALLAELSALLARPSLLPLGAFVVREHFALLSSADRAILTTEGIQTPLDLIFYDVTERMIRQVHEQSEKISVLLDQEPRSASEKYRQLFNKHLNRYLLGPHLAGKLAFGDARTCNRLQAGRLLSETIFLDEAQKLFPERQCAPLPLPPVMQRMLESISAQGRFDVATLQALSGKLARMRPQ